MLVGGLGDTAGRVPAPQQILEPTGLEINITRRLEANILLSCSFHVDSRRIGGKVSLRDVQMISNIIRHAKMMSGKLQSNEADAPSTSWYTDNDTSTVAPRQPTSKATSSGVDMAMYQVTAHFGSVNLVAVNDYYGADCSLPVLRIAMEDTNFEAGGVLAIGDLYANGQLVFGVDYYNAPLCVWEPILERCSPELTFTSTSYSNISFDVAYDGLIQFTLAGKTIREILKTIKLLNQVSTDATTTVINTQQTDVYTQDIDANQISLENEASTTTDAMGLRDSVATTNNKSTAGEKETESKTMTAKPALQFINMLGLPVDLFDSRTKSFIIRLPGVQSVDTADTNTQSSAMIKTSLHSVTYTPFPSDYNLNANVNTGLSAVQNPLTSLYPSISSLFPTLFDVKVMGGLENERSPILNLPLNVNKPRPYNLQLSGYYSSYQATGTGTATPQSERNEYDIEGRDMSGSNDGDGVSGGWKNKAVASEPIVEEVYENERYYPLRMSWLGPSKALIPVGDPPSRWTDLLSHAMPSPTDFKLPSSTSGSGSGNWVWIESDWQVDKTGQVGVEVDENGWWYSTSFHAFVSSTKHHRRCFKPLDSVRRRRWYRTRVQLITPATSSSTTGNKKNINKTATVIAPNSTHAVKQVSERPLQSLVVFWEPKIDPASGARSVTIRSGLEIKNTLDFSILVWLAGFNISDTTNNSNENDVLSSIKNGDGVIYQIAPFECWAVPLQHCHASSIRVTPYPPLVQTQQSLQSQHLSQLYTWSEAYGCRLQTLSSTTSNENIVRHVHCCHKQHVEKKISMQLSFQFKPRSIFVAVLPMAIIYNYLPCPIRYRCIYGVPSSYNNNNNDSQSVIGQQGKLKAGDKDKFITLDYSMSPQLSFITAPVAGSRQLYSSSSSNEEDEDASMEHFDWSTPVSLLRAMDTSDTTATATHDDDDDSKDKSSKFAGYKHRKFVIDIPSKIAGASSLTITVKTRLVASTETNNSSNSGTGGLTILEIYVYSRYLFINRTFNHLSLRTKRSASSVLNKMMTTVQTNTGTASASQVERRLAKSQSADLVVRNQYKSSGAGIGSMDQNMTSTSNYYYQDRQSYAAMANSSSCSGGSPQSMSSRDSARAWTEGGNQVVLFQADDNHVMIGLPSSSTSSVTVYSEPLFIQELGAAKKRFEICDASARIDYQFAFSLNTMPGNFRSTQILTVMAAYTIVNTTSEALFCHQVNSGSVNQSYSIVESMCCNAWHKSFQVTDTTLRFKTASTDWSIGTVDVNEIGTTVLILPRRHCTNTTTGESGGLVVAHIEVRLSDPKDNSYITVTVWASSTVSYTPPPITSLTRSNISNNYSSVTNQAQTQQQQQQQILTMHVAEDVMTCAFSFQNFSSIPLTVIQTGVDASLKNSNDINRFEITILPNSWRSFGWVDPNITTNSALILK